MSKTLGFARGRLNGVDLINLTADPTTGAGVSAAIGSLGIGSIAGVGAAYEKTGAADTAWQKLVQSLNWLSVKDFGATGDGTTDDTAHIQAAIDQANATGGNVVYFPNGTYCVTQLTLTSYANVQLRGAGPSSIIKWKWDAGSAAGSMITISDGAARNTIADLQLDGSALTNPAAGRSNHLVQIGTGAASGTIFENAVRGCVIGNMVASSGDGINVKGTTGNLVSRAWVSQNTFSACSRYSVCFDSGYEYAWINNNYMTGGETELALVASSDVNGNGVVIYGNEIVHTSGSVRHGMRIEGGATGLITQMAMGQNVILNGFATCKNVRYATCSGNTQTSGAYASTDPAFYISGVAQYVAFDGNLVDRASGASAGPCVALEKATGAPSYCLVNKNVLVNEKAAGGFIRCVDATQIEACGNMCRSSDAGSTTIHAIDFQAVTANVTDILCQGNVITAAAGTFASAVRMLANGANIVDFNVAANIADSIDYGMQFEVGGGGGSFTGLDMMADNTWDSVTGDYNNVGVTVRPRIGFNAGTFGANLFTGDGSPEGVITARIGSMYLRRDGGQGTSVYYKESGTGNTGWVALGGAPLVFGAQDAGTVATALYMAPGWIAAANATEIQMAMTRPGTLRNLRLVNEAAGTDAATVTFTVRVNGVDTTITAALANAATGTASDTTHTASVVAGDLVSISITKSGAVTAGLGFAVAALEIV